MEVESESSSFSENEEEEEEELECRVCRGPAEPDHPLFQPCKCNGSIAHTHQDCLEEWLSFKSATGGKCELCGYAFVFVPQYAPDAPSKLSFGYLMCTLVRYFVTKRLFKWFAFLLSVFTWLLIMPLVTGYVYYAWLKNPRSILDRMDYLAEDIVSGIVITVSIVISFLSIMSFADFLRFNDVLLGQQENNNANNRNNNIRANNEDANPGNNDRLWNEEDQAVLDEAVEQNVNEILRDLREQQRNNGAAVRGQRQRRLQQDAQGLAEDEIEIQLALNELLGLHSPFILLRNAFWYTCFIILYLGLVVYPPYWFGSAVLSVMPFNLNLPVTSHLLTLPDLITIFAGYSAIQVMNLALNLCLLVMHKIRSLTSTNSRAFENNDGIFFIRNLLNATLKITVLLFIKMAFLPLLLGFILDVTTLSLFTNISFETRMDDLINNVVTSVVLHWVMGITFMLVVTVSVLQLREVIHPMILKDIIRPQEPNVDLLANLLSEANSTHVKRIAVSLTIYITLLLVHIYIPIKAFESFGILPTWELHSYYWFGNLGKILELLIFHLSMLAFLEKFKNQIGMTQHRFLVKMTSLLKLTAHLLPCEVEKFELIGVRNLLDISGEVDEFWKILNSASEPFIMTNLNQFTQDIKEFGSYSNEKELPGITWNSRRVLDRQKYFNIGAYRIPTVVGRYRLRVCDQSVLLYKEVANLATPITRPPIDWDDLAGGGAAVQGRWSWDNEPPSQIETCTAQRAYFTAWDFCKFLFLLILSWSSTVCLLTSFFLIPPNVGRMVFETLSLTAHDPFGFFLGSCVIWACLHAVPYLFLWVGEFQILLFSTIGLCKKTAATFSKVKIFSISLLLWFVVAPLLVGIIYNSWVSLGEYKEFADIFRIFLAGLLLLHSWAALCYFGVFTKEFWADELGIFQNLQERRQQQPARGTRVQDGWQGINGKMAHLVKRMKNILVDKEWDSIDRVELVDEPINGIVKPLLVLLIVPLSIQYLTVFASSLLGISQVNFSIVYKIASVGTLSVQSAMMYREVIQSWYTVLQKVAKDELYLIGERLVNFHSR